MSWDCVSTVSYTLSFLSVCDEISVFFLRSSGCVICVCVCLYMRKYYINFLVQKQGNYDLYEMCIICSVFLNKYEDEQEKGIKLSGRYSIFIKIY